MKQWRIYQTAITGRTRIFPPWRLSLLWEPRDCWVGVFAHSRSRVYVFPVPMLGFRVDVAQRVRCTHHDEKWQRCGQVAEIKCVGVNKDGTVNLGGDYARDALCGVCGKPGPCPTDDRALHVTIPDGQQWTWPDGGLQ